MTQWINCPKRKKLVRINRHVCRRNCPDKHYVKCEVNRGAFAGLIMKFNLIPEDLEFRESLKEDGILGYKKP